MNVESSRHYSPQIFCKHIVYYSVSLALIGLLFAAIINTLFKYNRWPVYTEVLVVPQNEAKFSAITMCPLSNGYKLHVLQVSISLNINQLQYLIKIFLFIYIFNYLENYFIYS